MMRLLGLLLLPTSAVLCVMSATSDAPYEGYAVIALIVGALLFNGARIREDRKFKKDLLSTRR